MRPKPLILGILLLLCSLGIGLYIFAYMLPLKTAIWGDEGQETPGTILDMHQEYSSSSHRNIVYYAETAYQTTDGQDCIVMNTYDFVKWYALKEERNATVRYLKRDPLTSFEIHSMQARKPSIGWYVFLCAVFALPGLLLVFVGFSKPEPEEDNTSIYTQTTYSNRKPPRAPLG